MYSSNTLDLYHLLILRAGLMLSWKLFTNVMHLLFSKCMYDQVVLDITELVHYVHCRGDCAFNATRLKNHTFNPHHRCRKFLTEMWERAHWRQDKSSIVIHSDLFYRSCSCGTIRDRYTNGNASFQQYHSANCKCCSISIFVVSNTTVTATLTSDPSLFPL